jgi:hypothetical protein
MEKYIKILRTEIANKDTTVSRLETIEQIIKQFKTIIKMAKRAKNSK